MIGFIVLCLLGASYWLVVRDPDRKCIECWTYARAPHHEKNMVEKLWD